MNESQDLHDPTNRTIARKIEDRDYVSVILKRSDASVRHPDDTLVLAISEGVEQHARPLFSLFLSSVAAGLILSFSGMCVALASLLFPAHEGIYFHRLAVALVYPLGFIICIMSGTQLFTEHTATAIYPVLDKRVKIKKLFSLWGIVLLGNLLGSFMGSFLIYLSDPLILASKGYVAIGLELIKHDPTPMFFGAILAGWLMAQGGWLIMSTPSESNKASYIFAVTFIIGLGGLPHCIAGSSELFGAFFHDPSFDVFKSISFLMTAIVGNLLGGSLFVGVLNYGHIKKTQ